MNVTTLSGEASAAMSLVEAGVGLAAISTLESINVKVQIRDRLGNPARSREGHLMVNIARPDGAWTTLETKGIGDTSKDNRACLA